MSTTSPGQRLLIGVLIIGPFLIYLAATLVPAWNPLWSNGIFHFYIVSFTSLVAMVIAVFVLAGIGSAGAQGMFAAMAFMAMAGLFILHGAATPGVLMTGNHGIGISARLSLTAGAIFMVLAVTPMSPKWEQRILKNRRILWLVLLIAYVIYVGIILTATDFVATLERLTVLSAGLAIATVALLLWSMWRAWRLYNQSQRRLPFALTFAMPWLALAQLSQYAAPLWAFSWWIYHILMLAAFAVTMGALIVDYEQVLHFKITRYFTALAVIIGVPLMALLSEAAVRLSGSEATRWPMFGFSALSVLLLFVVLLMVVRRAETILAERAAALEAEKQWRADFTNLIVHDLKSPLSVVSVSLSLVMSGRLDPVPDKQRVPLERAQRGSKETLDLVDNLLDIERLEAGALRLTPSTCDVGMLVLQSVESLKPLAEAYELTLSAAVPPNLPPIDLDEALIRRVLQNLITNAIKFTPQHGQIKVETIATSEGVTITVIDNGPGVPPGQRERIFEKFTQLQGSERRGAGLGLAFCKLAVDAHGGRIWVEDAPGQGSRFAFSLPTKKLVSALPTQASQSKN